MRQCAGSAAAVEPSREEAAAARLKALRAMMGELGVDALLVPTDDPHLSEYVPDCFARREFISGFTGSAGTAVVPLVGPARLWTDGRYFLQARQQLTSLWELMRMGVDDTPTLEAWLASNLRKGQVVGIDPSVHSASFALELRRTLEERGIELQCLSESAVDAVWGDARPAFPMSSARLHPEEFAGKSAAQKLSIVRAALGMEGADALVVSELDEVAYLFNLRGADVPRTPVLLSYAVVEKDAATLFVDAAKVPSEVRAELAAAGVAVRPYTDALAAMAELSANRARVWADPARTNFAIFSALGDAAQLRRASPLSELKAMKNEVELEGMRAAHRRDGAALALAFAHLEAAVRGGRRVTEVDVDTEVTRRRAAQWGYVDNSFDTIAGYGPNGASIHYRAEPASCAEVGTEAMLLVDSGGQYLDGTTDVTRTMHFGAPSAHERACFTRVLKGHIALATAVFPERLPGFVVDAFARRPLWAAGMDYRHGTGHGVGAALAVHEGPQRIAQVFSNLAPIRVGMVVSNEPGYYEEGGFGIRIENLLVVVERELASPRPAGKVFVGFEPLTLVPIQRELIDASLLDREEVAFLDGYHARVREEILPRLEGGGQELEAARAWLRRNTAPLAPTSAL